MIKISYTKEQDLKKVLFSLAQIKNEFYQKNNFALFVNQVPKEFKSAKNVLFNKPLFDYVCTTFDWDTFNSHYYSDLAIENIDKHLSKDLAKFLQPIENKNLNLKSLKEASKTILDFHETKNCNVNIYLVSVGTPVSFRFINNEINIYVRFDVKNSQVIPAISNAIVSSIYPNNFETRQTINRYLFLNTKLKNLLDSKEYKRMYLEKDTFKLEINTISQSNYQLIGYPLNELFRKNDKGKLESSIIDLSKFTNQEYLILVKLVENQGKIVSFEEISTQLWGNAIEKKFSLEAIAKIIERLRDKLKKEGLKREVIFTKRGRGYLFVQ